MNHIKKLITALLLINPAIPTMLTSAMQANGSAQSVDIDSLSLIDILCADKATIETIITNNPEALLKSVDKRNSLVTKILLEHNANPNIMDADKNSPLTIATIREYDEIVRLLLKHHANINIRNQANNTPLILATFNLNLSTLHLLLQNNPDLEATGGRKNDTALIMAVREGCHPDAITLLLAHNARIEATDIDGNTALTLASFKGYEMAVDILLEHNANANTMNTAGNTPLQLAVKKNFPIIVCLLLKYNARTDIPDANNDTPLMLAVFHGHNQIVDMLLKAHDVPLEAINSQGNTALTLAISTIKSQPTTIKKLIDKGAQLNLASNAIDTPLTAAAFHGQPTVIHLLLEHKADINATTHEGNTALMRAAQKDYPFIIEELLKHKADVHAQNTQGHTALLYAASETPSNHTIKILLQSNANINHQNQKGDTALIWVTHLALHQANPIANYTCIIQQLISKGANPHITNKNKKTAASIANAQPRLSNIIINAEKEKALCDLHIQDWDANDLSTPDSVTKQTLLLESTPLPTPITSIVGEYADPYYAPNNSPIDMAIRKRIQNNRQQTQIAHAAAINTAAAVATNSENAAATCCTAAPDCNCARDQNQPQYTIACPQCTYINTEKRVYCAMCVSPLDPHDTYESEKTNKDHDQCVIA